MIIENLSTYGNTRSHEILAHAQTVSNFFIDALEQNDCNLKIVVGYYFDIEDSINTLEDIIEATVLRLDDLEKIKLDRGSRSKGTGLDQRPDALLVTPQGVEAAIQALKERCFNCKLSLPKIKFDKDFQFTYNKLAFQLEIYKDVFNIDRPKLTNYCHSAFALQKTCIPDILKLIAMLLTAYSAILALNKLPKISLGVFVKAIIGKLMAEVIANVKLSIDMSNTGVPCVLSAIEEIARAVPTKEDIYNLDMSDEVRAQLFPTEPYTSFTGKQKQPFVPMSVFTQSQNARLRNKEITKEQYDQEMNEYRKKHEPLRYYAAQLRSQTEMHMEGAENKISDAFTKISDTVTKAQDDINSYISSLLGVIDYFECENTRTGPDFSEVMAYMANLQTVINFFSSILGKWLTKLFEPLLCMDKISTDKIKEILEETPDILLTNEDLADIIADFLGQEAKVDSDGMSILIYDKPVKPLLPKLSLLGCNLKEFAEAHTIDNVIKQIIDNSVNQGDSSNRPDPYQREGFQFPPIPTIPRNVYNPPITVPNEFKFQPIPIVLPVFPRSSVDPIPLDILNRIRNRRPPTGTKITYPRVPGITKIITTIPKVIDKVTNPVNAKGTLPPTVRKLVGYIKDSPKPTDQPIDIIDITEGVRQFGSGQFLDELDSLLDFLYNPPNPKSPETPNDFIDLDAEDFSPDSNTSILASSIRRNQQQPLQQECKSFEDVLDILKSLGV